MSTVPSVQPSTWKAYIKRANAISKNYRNATPEPHNAAGLALFLITMKPQLATASWRQYKAAMLFSLRQAALRLETLSRERDAADVTAAIDMLQREQQGGALKTSTQTSAIKCKLLPDEVRVKIASASLASGSRWAKPLCEYLLAGVRAGLRPCEWATAEIVWADQISFVLRVRNAKYDGLRAHGEFRHLHFLEPVAEDRCAIFAWTKRATAAQAEGTYKALIDGIAEHLRRLCDILSPNKASHYTLYSVRHEFCARARHEGCAMDELAALMGHATDETASIHYGRRRGSKVRGMRSSLPKAAPDEVTRVRHGYEQRLARLRNIATKQAQSKRQDLSLGHIDERL